MQNGKVFACINKYKYGELNLKCPVIQCFWKFGGIRLEWESNRANFIGLEENETKNEYQICDFKNKMTISYGFSIGAWKRTKKTKLINFIFHLHLCSMTNLANEQRIAYKLNEAKALNIFHNLQFTTEYTNLFESQTIDLNCLSFNVQFLYAIGMNSMCPLTPIACHDPLFFQLKSIANYKSKQNWPTTKRTTTIRGAQIRKLQSIIVACNMFLCLYDVFFLSSFLVLVCAEKWFSIEANTKVFSFSIPRVPYVFE